MCGWMAHAVSALALLVAMSACGGEGGAARGRTALSAAHAGLHGSGGGAGLDGERQEPPRYRVSDRPRLQIGSVDGADAALYGVTGAIRLRDGRVVVANAGARELKFFDASGGFLASVGREGDGPGEFRGLSLIGALEDGRIAAMDMLLGRVSVFSANGAHDRTYRVSRGIGRAGSRIHMYGFLADGTLVGLEEVADEGVREHYGDYPGSALTFRVPVVQPVLIDTAGQAVPFARAMPGDERLSQMETGSGGGSLRVGGVARVPMPLLKSAAVAVRDGWVAIGHTSGSPLTIAPGSAVAPGSPITVYDAKGQPRVVFALDVASKEMADGARVRQAWVDEWTSNFASRRERRKWRPRYEEFVSATPASAPAFKSLALQEGGNVWLEAFDPSADENAPSRWHVQDAFDMKGIEDSGANIVVLPPGFRPHDIGSDYVLGVWRDELGIEFVRMYDLIEVSSDGS